MAGNLQKYTRPSCLTIENQTKKEKESEFTIKDVCM